MRRPLSTIHPVFYHSIVYLRCAHRHFLNGVSATAFAKEKSNIKLPFRVYKHQSVLIRKMGDSDIQLQENKVVNLSIALNKFNGILIKPGETFSFWQLVGRPTKSKGYLDAMLLSKGEAIAGTGGGLCQLTNLIFWLILHSPLTVIERHHHSFDPFPDNGRVVPFGSGATVFYNYIDLQFKNNTNYCFQLLFWFDQKCINGDLRIDSDLPYVYHVFEKNHKFIKQEHSYFRQNEIWRRKNMKKGSGEIIETECMIKNFARVKYIPENM